jgi:hypothetical protein
MANELFCYEQAARETDERGAVSELCAETFADTIDKPNRATARNKKFREPTLGRGRLQGSKISAKALEEQLAPALVQDDNPPSLAISGYDFYRAACVEAHRLLNRP